MTQPAHDVQAKVKVARVAKVGVGEKITVTDDHDPLFRWRAFRVLAGLARGACQYHADIQRAGAFVAGTVEADLALDVAEFGPGVFQCRQQGHDIPCCTVVGFHGGGLGKHGNGGHVTADAMAGVARDHHKGRVLDTEHLRGGIDHCTG